MTGYRDLARNRDFTWLWSSQLVSELGSAMSMFTFPLIGYALTHSAVLAGLPMAGYLAGQTAALLPAGLIADRVHRKRLMLATSAVGAVVYASVVAATVLGVLTLAHLVVAAALAGAAGGFFEPTEVAAVRQVVSTEQLPTALSQNQARQHVGSLVGAPLGGLLYGIGRIVPFAVDAVSYLFAFVALSRIRADLSAPTRSGEPASSEPLLRELTAGVREIWRRSYFRVVIGNAAVINLTINAAVFVATIRMVRDHVSPAVIGLVSTSTGVAGILGALAAPWIVDRCRTGLLVCLVTWIWVPGLVVVAFWSQPLVIAASYGVAVFLNPAGNASGSAFQMAVTPEHLQARVSGASMF